MVISHEDWCWINEIILNIYKSDIRTVLSSSCELLKKGIDFDRSFSNLANNIDGKNEYFHYQSIDMEEGFLDAYKDYYVDIDYCAWYTVQPKRTVYRDSDIIQTDKIIDSAFYNEWILPQGVSFGCGMNLAQDNYTYGNIALFRAKEKGEFSKRDLKVLDIISIHLCQYMKNNYPHGISKTIFSKDADDLRLKYNLTDREYEIVLSVKNGIPLDDLTQSLYISGNTLKKHLSNIYKKMEIKSRSQLLSLVFKEQ